MHECARRAGADFALVEREHREAFERLVEVLVVGVGDVGEEDVGRLAAEFERAGDDVLGRVLHDETAGRRLAGERDLGDALVLSERLAGLDAEAVDDVEYAGRQQVADEIHQHHDAHGRLLGGLQHDAVAGGERGSELPHRHQDREVPGDDLADDAERLVEVIGDRVVIDLGDRAFLGAHAAGEIAEVIDGERNVRSHRLADRLAVVERLDHGEQLEIALHLVGDLVEEPGALGRRGACPRLARPCARRRARARCPRPTSGRCRRAACR